MGGDLRFPAVQGPRTRRVRAVNAYLERLYVAAEHDPEVGRAFLRAVDLQDRPEHLLAPGVARRVLTGGSRRSRRTSRPVPTRASTTAGA